MDIMTKSGMPISEKTFGTLVSRDKACRHSAVELNLLDTDFRLVGRYLHHCGYRSIEEVREILVKCITENQSPFLIEAKIGKIVDFEKWKNDRA
jgi:hypothetical protein